MLPVSYLFFVNLSKLVKVNNSIMESENDNDTFTGTPPDLKRAAEEVANNILPSKSKELYEAEYKNFKEYCTKQKGWKD